MKSKNGITLVALVVTIIILLILAGITISQLTGNGLFERTKSAREEYEKNAGREEIIIKLNNIQIQLQKEKKAYTLANIFEKMQQDNEIKNIDKITAENEEIDYLKVILKRYDKYSYFIDKNIKISQIQPSGEYEENFNSEISINKELNVEIDNSTTSHLKMSISSKTGEKIERCIVYIDDELYTTSYTSNISISDIKTGNHTIKIIAIDEYGNRYKNKIINFTNEISFSIEELNLDKIIYIDSNVGDDTTGNGSKELPYKSLEKLTLSGVIGQDITYGIMLRAGTYNLSTSMFNLNNNKKIVMIGECEKTVLNINQIGTDTGSGGNGQYELDFYRMIWKSTSSTMNHINTINNMNLYNIVFDISGTYRDGFFAPRGAVKITLNNCLLPTNVSSFIRVSMTSEYIRLTNCYGGFTNGHGTSQTHWDYATNYVSSTISVDANYKILDNESNWKDVGTGKDYDNSQADLGVYGGIYSWENKDKYIVGNQKDENSKTLGKLEVEIEKQGVTEVVFKTNEDSETFEYYVVNDGKLIESENRDNFIYVNVLGENTIHNLKIIGVDKEGNIKESDNINIDYKNPFENESIDEYIYIDSKNGNNVTGNGTMALPYKNLEKIIETGIIKNDITYGIILKAGTYEFTTSMLNLNNNKKIILIGDCKNTILNINQIGTDTGSGGNGQYELDFYRMIWKSTSSTMNHINTINNMNLYNIVFDISGTYAHGFVAPRGTAKVTLNNCLLPTNVSAFLRTNMTTEYIRLTNCYGGFASGYGTSQTNWDYATNYVSSTITVDNNYKILDNESNWKDVGTGKDYDDTQADLGVYGGIYAWIY